MKKWLGMALTLLFGTAAWAAVPDFRNVRWEMSKEQVMEAEELPLNLITNESEALKRLATLEGEAKLDDLPCLLKYNFVDDKLAVAMYVVRETHGDHAKYLEDYEKIERMLERQYGPAVPGPATFRSVQEPHRGDPGAALAAGGLLYQTYREIAPDQGGSPTRVVHMLSSQGAPDHRVIFSHPELSQLQTDIIRQSQK